MFIVIAEKTQGLPILFISLTKPTWLGDSISSKYENEDIKLVLPQLC